MCFVAGCYDQALAYGRGGTVPWPPPQTLKIKNCVNSIQQWRNKGGASAPGRSV